MLEQYLTIKQTGEHEIVIDKSRFICSVSRAETEEEAQSFITQIKKKHNQATHNCSAYLIGERDQHQKANDDGEPSGTAGVPMLEVLKKRRLKNTVVVVTRYFGGIKLGAGGLVRAYGNSVSEALQAIGVVERTLATLVNCTISYPQLGKVENLLTQENYQIYEKNFTENVVLTVFVDQNDLDTFEAWLIEMTNGQVVLKRGQQKYREKSV